MDDDLKTVHSLVLEKAQIEGKLSLAGGGDFHFLLQDCSDLSDIISEVEDVSSQMGEKEHAALESKIKFSRKLRRKAKDMKNFEQQIVEEYESKHITLEHGKRMASIIKLLRSKNTREAKREAAEFYGFLEMGSRLEAIRGLLLKKRAHAERLKRAASASLSDLEWLEKEPPVDNEKIGRHEEAAKLAARLSEIWSSRMQALKSMPMGSLLREIEAEGLQGAGFPAISAQGAESMGAFLQKSKLEVFSAGQLYGMAGQSEQRLRHLGVDLPAFRQEVAARKDFLFGVMSFTANSRALEAGSPALAYLSKRDETARKLVERLAELGKTAEQDKNEWERANKIAQLKAQLAGADKAALNKSLQELSALEDVLDGKAAPVDADGKEKGKGLFDSIMEFFGDE